MTISMQDLVTDVTQKRSALFDEFRQKPSGMSWCVRHSDLADEAVQQVFRSVLGNDESLAVVATGGYGRRELAPGSDLDLTLIPLNEQDNENESKVRSFFRPLIETFGALGWPVGYAYRLPGDSPALDDKTRTGILDARLICGGRQAYEQFLEVFHGKFPVADFLISKINERKVMRHKWNETPLVAQPNIREGAGGLRERQAAVWLSKVLDLARPGSDTEYDFLLTVRNALHISTGRKEDVLLRTRRQEVAAIIGVSVEELSKDVMQASEAIASVWLEAISQTRKADFPAAPGVYISNGDYETEKELTLADAAVAVCRGEKLGIQPRPFPKISEIGDAPLVIECLSAGAAAVRALDSADLLEQILPELAACKYLLSSDSVHRYTVFQHSLRVLELLDEMQRDAQYSLVWAEASNSRPLYVAALLHDIGKQFPDKPHEVIGAEMAEAITARLRMSSSEADTVVFLVREHLTLAHMARTYDLARPATLHKLTRICERQDRLAMLYLLTIADTSAVNDDVWTPTMSASAEELYQKARAFIGTDAPIEDPAFYRSEALRRLQGMPPGREEVEELLRTMPTHYLLATPQELFPLHAEYISEANEGRIVVEFQNQSETETTDVTVCMQDLPKPGLLSRILGVAYALDLTLHSARAASTKSERPIALDVLSVSYRGQALPPGLSRVFSAELKRCVRDEKLLKELMLKHGKDPEQRQEMLTYRFSEGEPAILEIETPLGRGMPFRITKTIAELGWNVQVARIGLWAGRAVARFYVDSSASVTQEAMENAFGKTKL